MKYYADSECAHCDSRKKNCDETCEGHFAFLGRCKIFTLWIKRCDKCGCKKDSHKQDNYYYTYEIVTIEKRYRRNKTKRIRRTKKENVG